MENTCQISRENYGKIILWLCNIECFPNTDEKECEIGRVIYQDWYFWAVVLEKTLESPLDCKEIQPVNPQGNQSWIFIGRTNTKAETPVLWPPDEKNLTWCWEGLGAGGEGDDRARDGCMASPTWWTWVWANSGCWWLTGKPGVLQSMGSQIRTLLSDWTEPIKISNFNNLSHENWLELHLQV